MAPFCLYLSVALGLNLPPVVFTGKALVARNGGEGCSNWLILNAILCLINMAAALYISAKISYNTEDENAAPFINASVMNHEATSKTPEPEKTLRQTVLESTLTETRSRSTSRVKEILCYDPFVAVYIIIGLFYMVWQTVGIARVDCDEVLPSLVCGFLFISLGGMTFACSLCCLARN